MLQRIDARWPADVLGTLPKPRRPGRRRAAALAHAVVKSAAKQCTALAARMALRPVTVCEDDTFHPAIVLGKYAASRPANLDAGPAGSLRRLADYDRAGHAAAAAAALRRHIELRYGAHHSRSGSISSRWSHDHHRHRDQPEALRNQYPSDDHGVQHTDGTHAHTQ
jgi:hypothetical protein